MGFRELGASGSALIWIGDEEAPALDGEIVIDGYLHGRLVDGEFHASHDQ